MNPKGFAHSGELKSENPMSTHQHFMGEGGK